MDEKIKPSEVHRIGGLELNLLNCVRALPGAVFEGARLETGTPVFDLKGATHKLAMRTLRLTRLLELRF